MDTVTKKDLVDRISAATGQKRSDVKRTIQSFLDLVILELGKGNRLEFRDFGVFEIKERAPRVAQNPKTLERVEVPAKRTVKFKVGRLMRDCLESPERVESRLLEIAATVGTDGNDIPRVGGAGHDGTTAHDGRSGGDHHDRSRPGHDGRHRHH